MTLTIEPLDDAHDLDGFDCGRDELTRWLREHARHATRQGTRTYVLVDDDDRGRVVGYSSISPHFVEREGVPKKIGRGAPTRLPAILLAKLAVESGHQGQGLGRELLIRALEVIVRAARSVGGKIVVVDAIDESVAIFYERHDFERVPGDPLRLVLKLSTVAKALGMTWP